MQGDKDIAEALRQDPDQGFSLLIKVYQRPVYWHIRRLVVSHDDAEDATQETFIRIYRSLDRLSGVQSLRSWVLKVATHEALRIIGHRRTGEVSSIDDSDGKEAFTALADEYVDYGRTAEIKMQQAILSLPRKQQLVFNLRYYDELPFSEIAEVASTSAVGARMNYYLAKDKIVRYFKTHD